METAYHLRPSQEQLDCRVEQTRVVPRCGEVVRLFRGEHETVTARIQRRSLSCYMKEGDSILGGQ